MMPQIAFLNEKSQSADALEVVEAQQTMENFVDLLVELRKVLPVVSVVAHEKLPNLMVGNNYSVGQWLGQCKRERRQFLLSLANFAPFSAVRDLAGEVDPGVTVYKYRGDPFDGDVLTGVGLADLYGGLAVSFDCIPDWRISEVPVRIEQLLEDGEETHDASVAHAASPAHVNNHREWLIERIRRNVPDSEALWAQRVELLPHLRFLAGVQRDLSILEVHAFLRVREWLFELNDSVEEWLNEGLALPNYPPHTTDEYGARKNYCWWEDVAGLECFSWHGRYTPGAGRIHFRLSGTEKRAIVGYIGDKLQRILTR